MKLKTINSIRTNNFNDEKIMEKIGQLWKEAFEQLKNYNGITYGVYHQYESNYKGDYTLSVAIEAEDSQANLEITETTKYEVFSVDTENEHGIIKAWQEIWAKEDNGTLSRAYTIDFEKYYPNGDIEIYIAIK